MNEMSSALLTLIKSQSKLLALEATLAKQSIIPLLVSGVGLMILTVSTWLLCLTLIGVGAYHFTHNLAVALTITLAFNLTLWGLMLFNIMRYKDRVGFQRTREHLRQWLGDAHE